MHLVHITDISLYRLLVPPTLGAPEAQQRVHPLLAASALQWALRLITWRRRQLEPPPLFWCDLLAGEPPAPSADVSAAGEPESRRRCVGSG